MEMEFGRWTLAVILALALIIPGIAMANDVDDGDPGTIDTGDISLDVSEPHIDAYGLIVGADNTFAFDPFFPLMDLVRTHLDVGGGAHEYAFWAQLRSDLGYDKLTTFDLFMHFDGGADPGAYNDAGPGNENIHIRVGLTDPPTFTQLMPLNDEVILVQPTDPNVPANFESWVKFDSNNLNLGKEITVMIHLKFGEWLRWANADGGFGSWSNPTFNAWDIGNWNNHNSWNFQMTVTDNTVAANSESVYDEFGIFKYTSLEYFNTNLVGDGAPGQANVALTPAGGGENYFNLICNAPHATTIELDADLWNGKVNPDDRYVLITAANIRITGADLAATTPFADVQVPIYAVGTDAQWRILENLVDGGVQYLPDLRYWRVVPSLSWLLDIPPGTPEDTFTGGITLKMVTSGNPSDAALAYPAP
ncbi:MAG TPA: hypothetical protein ENN76_01880 [Euryarchaeota archaeon]|nr:hypothetical protein [Euryarchaeota archaeon]